MFDCTDGPEPGVLRFVHLSDIHFGQEKAGQLIPYNDIRDALIEDCRKMRQQFPTCSGILVSGDIAFSGISDQYKDAAKFLDQLSSVLGCDREAVCVVPGNHDVIVGHVTSAILEEVRDSKKHDENSVQGLLEKLSKEHEKIETHPCLKPQLQYHEFASQYGCHFVSTKYPYWFKKLVFPTREFHLVGLNTVQFSNLEDSKAKLVLGNAQFTLPRKAGIEYIVMMHHPADWCMDSQLAEQQLVGKARVLITGHEHAPAIKTIQHEHGVEQVVIRSGATTPPHQERFYKYTYNWLEMTIRELNGHEYLDVKIYPRLWVPERVEFVADSIRMELDQKGGRVFSVRCSERLQLTASEPTASTTKATIEVNEELPMSAEETDDPDFARVRLLFWRLPAPVRRSILTEMDVLSGDKADSISQTDERILLNRLKSQGKLGLLWDRIKQENTKAPDSQQHVEGKE